MYKQIEIICIGRELLIGKILNTNSYWLAKQSTSLGLLVNRITVLNDDKSEISNGIKESLSRNPDFIITTGGLGPTFDDKTLAGIADALKRKLKINEDALQMINEKFKVNSERNLVVLTPSQIKMATLPEGSFPLPNPKGTAPGVKLIIDKSYLISLPGVPEEMKAIFSQSVTPLLTKEAGNVTFFEVSIYSQEIVESNLAPLISKVMIDYPDVYIKSHPQCLAEKSRIEIHLSSRSENSKKARERLTHAIIRLSNLIEANEGKVTFNKKISRK